MSSSTGSRPRSARLSPARWSGLSQTFITDVPLALLAAGGFLLTVFAEAGFVIVLLGAGLVYEVWSNARSWTRRAHSFAFSVPAALVVVTGAIDLSLTAEIFWEGLKAGLLTFGGAFTVIPFLQESAVEAQDWLTDASSWTAWR